MKKIFTVVGARPQFIKLYPVSRALKATLPKTEEIIVHTGQHYDNNMSQIFFDEMSIPQPDYNLNVHEVTHGNQTALMLQKIEELLIKEKPNLVIVYGDTNSTLAGALAAAKLQIPIAHVEAGLRSFNKKMPEEINRVLTDHISDVLFATSEISVNNLKSEGLSEHNIINVGDVMYDAVRHFSQSIQEVSLHQHYILVTIHRAENTDNPLRLKKIFNALIALSAKYKVLLPLHPRTRAALIDCGLLDKVSKALHLLKPQGFINMLNLEEHAELIITDSGGVQKEAFYLKTPCVTLRDETEWTELVSLGWNRLVSPTEKISLYDCIIQFMKTHPDSNASPYGEGDASIKIADYLKKHFFR